MYIYSLPFFILSDYLATLYISMCYLFAGVIDYLTNGRISADHADFKRHGYSECLRKLSMSNSCDVYTHDFRLQQAYTKEIMPFTNYTYVKFLISP